MELIPAPTSPSKFGTPTAFLAAVLLLSALLPPSLAARPFPASNSCLRSAHRPSLASRSPPRAPPSSMFFEEKRLVPTGPNPLHN